MAITTQSMIINLTQSKLPPIIMHRDEQGRRIIFYLVDENGDIIILNDNYSARFQMVKPDGNFVHENMSISDAGDKLTLNQTMQMTTVNGISYYDINIYSGSDMIYTGQGRVIVDDHILDDDVISSVSEVNGLVFPDDFATTDNIEDVVEDVISGMSFAVIADNHQNLTETWSSEKIADEIADKTEINDNTTSTASTWSSDKIADEIADKTEINDNTTSTASTWSSDKIADEIADKTEIDDNTTSTASTWSSDKIADEIAGAGGGVAYSTTEHAVGTWINGDTVYELSINTTSPAIHAADVMIADLTSYNIDTLISIDGVMYIPNLNQRVPVLWSFNQSLIGTVYMDGTNLKQIVPINYTNAAEVITIRYTKRS